MDGFFLNENAGDLYQLYGLTENQGDALYAKIDAAIDALPEECDSVQIRVKICEAATNIQELAYCIDMASKFEQLLHQQEDMARAAECN